MEITKYWRVEIIIVGEISDPEKGSPRDLLRELIPYYAWSGHLLGDYLNNRIEAQYTTETEPPKDFAQQIYQLASERIKNCKVALEFEYITTTVEFNQIQTADGTNEQQ